MNQCSRKSKTQPQSKSQLEINFDEVIRSAEST